MSKICLIRQPAGLGDVLFCQKIARTYIDRGFEVIWPLIPEFAGTGEYIKNVKFPSITEDFFGKEFYYGRHPVHTENFIFLPLQDADQHYPNMLIMDSKYQLAGITMDNWQFYLSIVRNEEKENRLFTELNLMDTEYVFVNKSYGSPPAYRLINHMPEFDRKVVELSFKKGYHLCDWLKVLEKAKEIHTVDTVLSYIIEVSTFIDCPLFLYSRYSPKSFHQTRHLFSRNWNYVL